MSETIKVSLEADASQLTGEFKKAQAAASAFSQQTLPLVSAELDRTYRASEKLRKGNKEMTRGFRSNADNMIIFAQAADDAQYGMRGLSNQIPQLAQALGLGAGLAGGIAIAAVAITQFLPLLKKLFTDTDAARINAATEAVAKRYAVELEALRKLDRKKEIREEVSILTAKMVSYAEQELRVQDQRLDILNQQAAAVKLQRGLQDEIARERAGIAEARITGTGASAEQARQDIILAAAEQARAAQARRMQEDIARARQDAAISNESYDRIAVERENIRKYADAQLKAAEDEINRLRRAIAYGEAAQEGFKVRIGKGEQGLKEAKAVGGSQAAGAQAAFDQFIRPDILARDASAKRLAADKDRLALQTAFVEKLRQDASIADEKAKTELAALSARIDAAEREKRTIEQTAEARKELDDLKAQRERLQAQQAITAARKQEADEAARAAQQAERESKSRAKEAERAAREQAQRTATRGEFAAELRVLELRARGQDAAAEALEKEVRLRRESRQLAEQLGVTEKQALELARRRQQLLDAGGKRGRSSDSKIRNFAGFRAAGLNGGVGAAGRIGGGPSASLNGGVASFRVGLGNGFRARGLRTSALDREAAARATPSDSLASKAASYYERSLANDEALIKIFNKLGAY